MDYDFHSSKNYFQGHSGSKFRLASSLPYRPRPMFQQFSSWAAPGLSGPGPYDSYQGFTIATNRPPLVTYATTKVPSSSELYHLEFFEWTSSLLDPTKDALTFDVNGTEVILKLSKDVNPPKAADGDSKCSNSTSVVGTSESAGSACVYLTRCYAARSITAEAYQKSFCIVDNSYAGVCCPRNEIDKST